MPETIVASPVMQPDRSRQIDYLIEEMKAARLRIDEEIKTINQFEILCITAIFAAYYIFLYFRIINIGGLVFISIIPVVICAYGLFRYRAHADVIKIHERYIKFHIEKTIFDGSSRPRGLVKYYDQKKTRPLETSQVHVLGFYVPTIVRGFSDCHRLT
jgi:hypothetical protein